VVGVIELGEELEVAHREQLLVAHEAQVARLRRQALEAGDEERLVVRAHRPHEACEPSRRRTFSPVVGPTTAPTW
jgi:hypothetical protein